MSDPNREQPTLRLRRFAEVPAEELQRIRMPREQAVLLDHILLGTVSSTMTIIGRLVEGLGRVIDSNAATMMKTQAPVRAIVRVLKEKGALTPEDVEHFERAVREAAAEIDAGQAVDLALGDDPMREVRPLLEHLQSVIRRFAEENRPSK